LPWRPVADKDAGVTDVHAFSVVIPTYNRAAHVAPCLAPFLLPGAGGIDVTVVDDGSSDDTEAQVLAAAAASRGAEIRYLKQANAGPSAARNRGFRAARQDWVVFLDVDDRWFDWSIDSLKAAMAEAAGASLLFFRTRNFADDAELTDVRPAPLELVTHDSFYTFDGVRPIPQFGTCNVAVRRRLLDEVGGFAESIRCAEDMDLFYRMSGRGPVVTVVQPAIVGYRTNSGDSLSANPVHMRVGMDFLTDGLRNGRYPEPLDVLAKRLDETRRIWGLNYFARGQMAAGYSMILPEWQFLLKQWGPALFTRTVLTPVLALVRPSSYHFDWRTFLGMGPKSG
jgi:GT2 family glycosyltransferase